MDYIYVRLVLLLISVIFPNFAIPSVHSHLFVAVPADEENEKNNIADNVVAPEIYEMHILSDIRYRFAKTMIRSKVRNTDEFAQEAKFFVILPEAAFISGFIMEVDNTNYTAFLESKEEAQRDYSEAKSSGLAAAYIGTNFRDSNRFMVSVNIKPQAKAAFYLTYEELLKRQQGSYEHVINISPGQLVQNLNVEVSINESQKLTLVEARPISSGKEISRDQFGLNPNANVVRISDNAATIRFSPNLEKQRELSRVLKTAENIGFVGQFVVRYDVERDSSGGQVLIRDGYFVHFFAPSGYEPLRKHVVFLLDTSMSMKGDRLDQLKAAMTLILDQMHGQDLLHLVEFNTNVKVWDLNDFSESVWFPMSNEEFDWDTYDSDEFVEMDVQSFDFPNAAVINSDSIRRAKNCISNFNAEGATDIFSAFKVALHLVNITQRRTPDNATHQPIIIFLTDGIPNHRYLDSTKVRDTIETINEKLNASIFALSLGNEADRYFTRLLSEANSGFSRHIYVDLDASLQLKNFYETISSPLLKNVKFEYEKAVASLTIITYPIYFDGSELIVAGFCGFESDNFTHYVTGYTDEGPSYMLPVVERSILSVERIWAYLTIKQLLDNKDASDEDRRKFEEKATQLALKYSFVTPFTSLVVLQLNDSYTLDMEEANINDQPSSYTILSTSQPNSTASVNLETKLPWLKNALNKNGTVNLPTGSYKISSSNAITEDVPCPKTPMEEPSGSCKLLSDCPKVYSVLTELDIFVKYSCVLQNEYAGICCPNDN